MDIWTPRCHFSVPNNTPSGEFWLVNFNFLNDKLLLLNITFLHLYTLYKIDLTSRQSTERFPSPQCLNGFQQVQYALNLTLTLTFQTLFSSSLIHSLSFLKISLKNPSITFSAIRLTNKQTDTQPRINHYRRQAVAEAIIYNAIKSTCIFMMHRPSSSQLKKCVI